MKLLTVPRYLRSMSERPAPTGSRRWTLVTALLIISGCNSVTTVANPTAGEAIRTPGATGSTQLGTEVPADTAPSIDRVEAVPVDPSADPVAATDAAGLAAQIIEVESAITNEATTGAEVARLAHLQQVIYRKLSANEAWDTGVFAAVPVQYHDLIVRQIDARRKLLTLSQRPRPDTVPAWELVSPAPAEELLDYYQEAEAAFGVSWEILAAINLVETGMGRIRGLSIAGAQGPMQFIPGTWDLFGEGDVNDYRDSIMAAARMLDHHGVQDDPAYALWRYNNHDNYGIAVQHYAELMRMNPRRYLGFYHWEIYYLSAFGDIHLPVGYRQDQRTSAMEYITTHPQANLTCEAPRVVCLPS